MIKREELSNPDSCMSRAHDNEMTFVLLERDVAVPETIRFWADLRVKKGKNNPGDPQILEALKCASVMEERQEMAKRADLRNDWEKLDLTT